MKITSYIFAGLAVLALMIAAPVNAEMSSISDTDLDEVSAKGDASVSFGGYSWNDSHATDGSTHKGAVANVATAGVGINTANVWGTYAGAESFGSDVGLNTESTATSNAGFGGF